MVVLTKRLYNVDPFNSHPATFGRFDQNSVAILGVISKCCRFDQKGCGHFGFVVFVATLYLLCNKWKNTRDFFCCIDSQTGLTIRDTRVVIQFPTNSLEPWVIVLNGFFYLYLAQIITSMRRCHAWRLFKTADVRYILCGLYNHTCRVATVREKWGNFVCGPIYVYFSSFGEWYLN